jgi:hypothetical protein
MIRYTSCPACSHRGRVREGEAWCCTRCQALYGHLSDLEFYSGKYLIPFFGRETGSGLRYVDFMIRRPDGRVERFHGWIDRATRKVVQIG